MSPLATEQTRFDATMTADRAALDPASNIAQSAAGIFGNVTALITGNQQKKLQEAQLKAQQDAAGLNSILLLSQQKTAQAANRQRNLLIGGGISLLVLAIVAVVILKGKNKGK